MIYRQDIYFEMISKLETGLELKKLTCKKQKNNRREFIIKGAKHKESEVIRNGMHFNKGIIC